MTHKHAQKPEHTAQPLIQAVTNDLLAGGMRHNKATPPDFLSYGDNAIRASKVIDAILKIYYGNRDIGYWNDKASWPGRPFQA